MRHTTDTRALKDAGPLGGARLARLMSVLLLLVATNTGASMARASERLVFSASSEREGNGPAGAMDGDRFGVSPGHAWISGSGSDDGRAWWQVEFPAARRIGAILQVVGDHEFVLTNAPVASVWKVSEDGVVWRTLEETRVERDSRLYRVHRLRSVRLARFVRFEVLGVAGAAAVLREVEFFDDPAAQIAFPDWILAVNVTHDGRLPGHGQEFIPLAKSCAPGLQAQQVWLTDFSPELVAIEPRPLCAFLSGSFKDWCEVNREHWRGTQRVLKSGRLPMWASCGGAQGLAILAETGVDRPWDCPHCRDPLHPKLPIYGHIGHVHAATHHVCGDYSDCLFERGPHRVRRVEADPVFAGLPEEFEVMESHCGQVEWAPRGWKVIAVGAAGTRTRNQCLRVTGRPIYAAQFHIEMAGTPEVSRVLMGNFLKVARADGR